MGGGVVGGMGGGGLGGGMGGGLAGGMTGGGMVRCLAADAQIVAPCSHSRRCPLAPGGPLQARCLRECARSAHALPTLWPRAAHALPHAQPHAPLLQEWHVVNPNPNPKPLAPGGPLQEWHAGKRRRKQKDLCYSSQVTNPHRSPLTAHLSPLTAHLSPFTLTLTLTSHLSPLPSLSP